MSGRLHGNESAVGDLSDRAVEWIKQRLANSPIGVIGNKPILDAALAGSINDDGLGLDGAWERFQQVVAPNNIGLDSEHQLKNIAQVEHTRNGWVISSWSPQR